ncbi:MAG: DEAD/DEAH box helicase [Candidatus Omnitrophica bacterium]|nr:DEAD/DEAH box helicase [Candidatus Omnitrophota bacterium]
MQYDPFQQRAIEHISQGHSVIVSAPTGAGKTVIAEHVINECLAKNSSAIYTAPIKALSNQKFRDFQHLYKDKIGILTGDVSINAAAPILIMTTEIFRNKVLENDGSLECYSWIIFDEIHYLDDYERGTVWEESLIFLPKHMNMLALSATIPNIGEFAAWLTAIHKKPIKVIAEDKRPVPLHFFYQYDGTIVDHMAKLKRLGFGRNDYYHYKGRHIHKDLYHKQNRSSSLIRHLQTGGRLPCIYFVFSRKRCEYLAEEISGFNFLTGEESRVIREMYENLLVKFGLTAEKSALILQPLVERGIAYHHAGMLPTLKEVVERLFTSKLIKVIFTTETFALGINMPARTVVFDDLRKFYGQFHRVMRTRDFYQMAGRAGRRGIDPEGYVYTRVSHQVSPEELHAAIYGNYEKVKSRFNLAYATILNLYGRYGEKLYDIYPLSFHFYQEKAKGKEKALHFLRQKVRLLEDLGYIENGRLSEKGSFARAVYGYELALGELYADGTLEKLSVHELGILSIALVFEPRKISEMPPLHKDARKLFYLTAKLMKDIQNKEKRMGILPSKSFFYHLSASLAAWMQNEPFDRILSFSNADEGELIRYFRMTIQILREILEAQVSPNLKKNLKTAIALINRDIVDAEKQLRIE